MANEGSAGLIGRAEMNGQFDNSASSAATGGQIRNGMIFNSSGAGSLGLVKMLAIAGIALIAWRMFRGA